MGDTGSMFIGAVMVGIAVVLKIEFLLLLICFTCVFSSVSVIMQRTYFKLTHGKRIFKMSPIHHHFEMCGMTENAIVRMYAIVTAILSVVAILSMHAWIKLP
jgi:phospho-N-acetylmuramoyl-pentapeptide-transferase